eukprot:164325-Pyramimonas_sp.AAC.1
MIVIDEDDGNPIRANLLGQVDIQFARLGLLRLSTMEHALRLLERGTCRGVWMRLQRAAGDLARNSGKTRRQSQRLMAASIFIARLI